MKLYPLQRSLSKYFVSVVDTFQSQEGIDYNMKIKQTGLFVIIMAVCKEDATPVKLLGTIESMNPCKMAMQTCTILFDIYARRIPSC